MARRNRGHQGGHGNHGGGYRNNGYNQQRTDTGIPTNELISYLRGRHVRLDPALEQREAARPRMSRPIQAWGLFVDKDVLGTTKMYAILGHVPGIYTDWNYVEKNVLKGFSGNGKLKVNSVAQAWQWLHARRTQVDDALKREKGRAWLALQPALSQPQQQVPQQQQQQQQPIPQQQQLIAHQQQLIAHQQQQVAHPPQQHIPHVQQQAPQQQLSLQQLPREHRLRLIQQMMILVPQGGLNPQQQQALMQGLLEREQALGLHGLPHQHASSSGSSSRVSQDASEEPASDEEHIESETDITEPEVELSLEQERVVQRIMRGRNVFYTGSAGCGKSVVLRAFKKRLEKMGKRVFVTAPTNLAALNVGGITTYSYANWHVNTNRIGLRSNKFQTDIANIQETDVLVIDEISMSESNFLERLNHLMKVARGNDKPFGGVQMVVTGDFCQLPPVKPFKNCFRCGKQLTPDRNYKPSTYECKNNNCEETMFYDRNKWAFLSNAWRECNFECFHLTKIYRQGDEEFQSILQAIRQLGIDETPREIKNRLLVPRSGMEGAMELSTHNDHVREVNEREVARLPGRPRVYESKDFLSLKDADRNNKYLLHLKRRPQGPIGEESHRYEITLTLKRHMRVVLTKNISPEEGLVNGSQGQLVGFEPFAFEKLPKKNVDLSGPHARYAQDEIERFCEENGNPEWPIVRFDNGKTRTIYPDCLVSEHGTGKPPSRISRTQVPLMAGYAMTIHKSQGMSLDRVKVNLARAFEEEQVYVALSRARSLERLAVTALPEDEQDGPNPEVQRFYRSFRPA